MEFSSEFIADAKEAASPEEIVAMANELNMALSLEDARRIYKELQVEGDLVSEDLDRIDLDKDGNIEL